MKILAAAILLVTPFVPGIGPGPAPQPAGSHRGDTSDPYAIVRGMTISCPGSGRIWGSDAMVECMADLKTLGINWIAIHPYAGIRNDGTVGGDRMDRMYGGDVSWLTRPIAEAHRLGLKIMIKPHIAYWGSGFSWRGAIRFQTPDQWDRFFDTYQQWITRVADICKDADAFAVGTELDGTVQFEDAWRRIIATVRAKTSAPLTYSANWDAYQRITFWDALDVIGVQSYFPLVDHDGLPTPEELSQGWREVLDTLHRFARPYGKKVVLGELGYNSSSRAARTPWDHRTGGPDADEIQRRCLTAALEAIRGDDVVVGAFLWKWFPESHRHDRNFLLSTPALRQVIASHWLEPDAARFGQ